MASLHVNPCDLNHIFGKVLPYFDRLDALVLAGKHWAVWNSPRLWVSAKGDPDDSTLGESFMKTLKVEDVYLADHQDLQTQRGRLITFWKMATIKGGPFVPEFGGI